MLYVISYLFMAKNVENFDYSRRYLHWKSWWLFVNRYIDFMSWIWVIYSTILGLPPNRETWPSIIWRIKSMCIFYEIYCVLQENYHETLKVHCETKLRFPVSLHWRHNDHDGVSNHQPHGYLLNRLFRRRSKKTSKLRVTGLCVGNSPGPVNSPHNGPVTRKMFPFDDVIMSSYL